MMDTETKKLRAFVCAVESGSIAAAADKLGYSVSSISRMIHDLETSCTLRLLERSKIGVRPTSDGRALLPRARRILSECDGFGEEAANIAGLQSGTVRIGTVSSVATHVLPAAISTLRKTHPALGFELLLGSYSEIELWLAEGRVDLGTLWLPVNESLSADALVTDCYIAVVNPSHPLAKASAVPISSLENEPFIELDYGDESEVAQLFEDRGLHIDPILSTCDNHAVLALVEAGLGVAIMPSLSIRRTTYNVKCLPLDIPALRNIGIAWRGDGIPTAAARAFIEILRENEGKTRWTDAFSVS